MTTDSRLPLEVPLRNSRRETARRRWLGPRALAVCGLWLAALIAWGCAGIVLPLTPPGEPRLKSFLGVSLGEPLADVELRYRDGSLETSPTGEQTYRIDGVRAGSIEYQTVRYEFVDGSGMQLVLARFAPESAGPVYDALKQALGKPSSLSGPETLGPAKLKAVWERAGSEQVSFSGPLRRLAIVGPWGAILKEDIRMREEE